MGNRSAGGGCNGGGGLECICNLSVRMSDSVYLSVGDRVSVRCADVV